MRGLIKSMHVKKRSSFVVMPALAITACVLALAVTVAGTYAWMFASSTCLSTGNFETATVKLDYEPPGDVKIMGFAGSGAAITAQKELKNPDFDQWLTTHFQEFGNILTPETKVENNSIVQLSCTFENKSSIPVYFRIQSPAPFTGFDYELGAWGAVVRNNPEIKADDDANGGADGTLILDDGYFYFKQPLYPDDKLTVTYVLYIKNVPTSGSNTFDAKWAEIIQGMNNAIFMADGWEDTADEMQPPKFFGK